MIVINALTKPNEAGAVPLAASPLLTEQTLFRCHCGLLRDSPYSGKLPWAWRFTLCDSCGDGGVATEDEITASAALKIAIAENLV